MDSAGGGADPGYRVFLDHAVIRRKKSWGRKQKILLDAPHLRSNKFACGRIRTSIVNGACVAVDSKGRVTREKKRLSALM
jgi:hypothetical protein